MFRKVLCTTAAAVLGMMFASHSQAADKKITIGLVAKSQSNPVFQAAYSGAKDAAKELGPKYGVDVTIDWQTPPDEDAQKQAQAIEQIANSGAQGIAVSCSDANTVTPAINKAIDNGAVVMCFDSDAPKSKRLCYYGTDDETCGKLVMQKLAKEMGDKGTIAILAGNQSAPNLQRRVKGVKDELANHPNMKLLTDGVFYHVETPEEAAKALASAQSTHPEIEGWALVGGWPLFTKNACRWNPGEVKVVSVDALPPQLAYLDSGHVQVLLAQDCYGWGYKSVQILLDKIVKNQDPPQTKIFDPLTEVTKDNAKDFGKKWDKWLGK
ncbi:MAG TPA: substrate-binding domain-containing protein [Tepidisphaeraceae bacterium]|jgi:ribose transport system substrate-binding protein|nr:substrate-binding domain-containing protein [Tepidisphaeraceae bacterium]